MWRDKLRQLAQKALLEGESKKSQSLRYLVSLIDKKAMASEGEMEEQEEMAVLQKEAKNKLESLEAFVKAGREDLAAEVRQEMAWLEEFLPSKMTEEELGQIVAKVVAGGEKNFGLVMKKVLEKTGGRVDGGVVAAKVKQALAQ